MIKALHEGTYKIMHRYIEIHTSQDVTLLGSTKICELFQIVYHYFMSAGTAGYESHVHK